MPTTTAPAMGAALDLSVLPEEVAKYVDDYLGEYGRPVGFRTVTEHGPRCHRPCFAPGSSPHSHSTIVGYELIAERAIVLVTPDGVGLRCSSVHPFPA